MDKKNAINVITVVTVLVYAMALSFSQEEWRICDPSKGEPFIPLFFISEMAVRKAKTKGEIWDYARKAETMLNTLGWKEMLKAAVDENDTFYSECKKEKEKREKKTFISVRELLRRSFQQMSAF